MSNLGQAALIVVGTVVGAYFGNPQLGFALGGLAGSVLFPTQLPAGPRITDNRTTTANIGEPVPILFGTADLSGTVIWLGPIIESAQEQGGKGGPEQKIFNYNQSIAIGLCERVDDTAAADIGAVGGITRIWENGAIVYDIRPQQEANTALGFVAETDDQYANRLLVSAQYAETFTFYLGDELQDPDPTIEAVEGMGNVPGLRGLAYIVYPNRALQTAQGLRHPNFTFECYQSGTGECEDQTNVSTEVLYPWIGGGPGNPINPLNTHDFQVSITDSGLTGPNPSGHYANQSDVENALITRGYPTIELLGYGYTIGGNPEIVQAGGQAVSAVSFIGIDPTTINLFFNFRQPPNGFFDMASLGGGITPLNIPLAMWHIYPATMEQNSGVSIGMSPGSPTPPFTVRQGRHAASFWIDALDDGYGQVSRAPGAPLPPCNGLPPSPTNSGYAVLPDGRIIQCNEWVRLSDPGNSIKVLQKFSGTNPKSTYPLNPCLLPADPDYANATFWTNAYNAAVASGAMAAGKVYGSDYPVTQNFYYTLDQVICEGSGAEATVASIVLAICKRAGLAENQIDVSDLTEISVAGYSISGICDAADIISPLRSIAFFDCVESGNILRFPTRGKEVVATLTEDQIGCYDGGQGGDGSSSSNVPPSIAVSRQDETTLPRSIRLHYKAVSRDYQDGEEDSPFRLTTRAVDDQDVSIPVCIGDTQAAQAAETLWSDAWAGQNSYDFSIDQSLAALEVGDCIGVPIDGVIQRLRIVSDSNGAFILRKLSCVGDDQGSYISFAVATPPIQKPSTLVFISPTLAVFLNIPSLMDSDNNAGFYVVAYPDPTSAGNTWNGAFFYQSIDGVNYTQQVIATQAATVGTINTAIPPSEAFTWDDYTVLTVNLPASESLESRTDEAVLAGANAAAMGADGRWEIIQFANAEQVSPTQWVLSRLLRGRRGTEYVMGTSQAGDQFVMISTGDIVRIPLSVSQIGRQYIYKVVSVGASFSTGNIYDFTSRGTALVPFSPVDAHANFLSDGDIEISWTRRDRLGQTLMSGMDVPLSDYPESFQVDIVQGPDSPSSPAVVFRTLATGTTSVIYSAADFASDYPSDSPHGPIHVHIYQMSLTMGRGTPEVATLEIV